MRHSSKHVTLTFLAIAFLIVASLACAGPTAPATSGGGQGQPTQPRPASQKATVPAEQPTPTGALKECFDSFPTYPNVKPDAEWGRYLSRMFGALGQSAGLGYVTGDSPQQVAEFYTAEAPKQGWEPAPLQGGDSAGGATLIWGKEDKYLIRLMVMSGDDDKGAKIGVVCTVATE